MNNHIISIHFLAVFLLISSTGLAHATVDITFVWTPGPEIDQDDMPCAEAVVYEVFLQRDDEHEESVGMVYADTTYTLAAESGITQRVRVCGYDKKGRVSELSEWSDPLYFDSSRGVQAPPEAPELTGNFPNPFNPETKIVYGIPVNLDEGTPVGLEIYNIQGYRVRILDIELTPGWHEITWDGADNHGVPQATGIYLTRFVCGTSVEVSKMMMIK